MKTQKYRDYSLKFYYEVAGIRCEVLDPQKNVLQAGLFQSQDEAERWGRDLIDRIIRSRGDRYSQGNSPFEADAGSSSGTFGRKKRSGRGTTVPVITILLILANVLVFLFEEMTGGSNGDNAVVEAGAQYAPLMIREHEWWRLFTSMFIHFGF
ncbi:MAG: rhomboid family intramembrane serine protease, partial [Bilifractor sp.]|nr:rhomboid family intramembrane serine protease [Bilifractor sp.]